MGCKNFSVPLTKENVNWRVRWGSGINPFGIIKYNLWKVFSCLGSLNNLGAM